MGKISDAIDKALYTSQDTEPRSHMGMSSIGDECGRKIWYAFRWVSPVKFEPSTLRLFDRGKREEDRFVGWLKQAGITVHQIDPSTGLQYRFKGYKGHAGGEIDGVGDGLLGPDPYLLEFKTHNEKSFKDLCANGVAMSKPVHYVQMQMYMGNYQLKQALYLAIDKNSDKLYDEVINFDKACYEKYSERLRMLIDAPEPPPRISNNPSWFECKWCDHHPVCHRKQDPLKNCRTCAHSTPVEEGNWKCENPECLTAVIPIVVIRKGCDKYFKHPME